MPASSNSEAVYWSYEVSIGHRSPRSLSSRRWWIRVRLGFDRPPDAGPERYGGWTSPGVALIGV
jgi:hypothetical protein